VFPPPELLPAPLLDVVPLLELPAWLEPLLPLLLPVVPPSGRPVSTPSAFAPQARRGAMAREGARRKTKCEGAKRMVNPDKQRPCHAGRAVFSCDP
jgi:hypothetical protein